ncbi:hypothetical protein GCM10009608_81250 [Pseudonocardia alaniniphila]
MSGTGLAASRAPAGPLTPSKIVVWGRTPVYGAVPGPKLLIMDSKGVVARRRAGQPRAVIVVWGRAAVCRPVAGPELPIMVEHRAVLSGNVGPARPGCDHHLGPHTRVQLGFRSQIDDHGRGIRRGTGSHPSGEDRRFGPHSRVWHRLAVSSS